MTGTYTDVPGLPACIPCSPGQYASQPGSTSCTACAAGSVNAWVDNVKYQDWSLEVLGYFQVGKGRVSSRVATH